MPESVENALLLSDASHEREEAALPQQTEQRFELLSSYFPEAVRSDCGLDAQDMKIITLLMEQLIDGKGSMNTGQIMRGLKMDKMQALVEVQRLQRLSQAGVLETDADHDNGPYALLGASFSLSHEFMSSVFATDKKQACPVEPYKDNLEYLADQFERVRLLQDITGNAGRRMDFKWRTGPVAKGRPEKELADFESRIEKRVGMTGQVFPFEAFKKKHELDQKEALIVLALLRKDVFQHRGYDPDDLIELISQTPLERMADMRLFEGHSKLFKQKIIKDNITQVSDS